MKIWHISDTHTYHGLLQVPSNIEMVIFSGDCSNPMNVFMSQEQVLGFMEWFAALPIKYKIFVAGNHDAAIEAKLITKKDFESKGIYYLENEFINIEGINIFGSPITPTFGMWSFMRARDKTNRVWQKIPDTIDIIVTHGPPKGILDLSYNREHVLEFCGDSALRKRVLAIKPMYHLFGHIHNNAEIINSGIMQINPYRTIFSNGSVVTDRKFGILTSNGNILDT